MSELFVRPAIPQDVEALESLLGLNAGSDHDGIFTPQETADIVTSVRAYVGGDLNRTYFIAGEETPEGNENLLGVMGLMAAREELSRLAPSVAMNNASELIDAYVTPQARGKHVGTTLARVLAGEARLYGSDDLFVVSSERFRESAWPFWQKVLGEPVEVNPTQSIWRRQLS